MQLLDSSEIPLGVQLLESIQDCGDSFPESLPPQEGCDIYVSSNHKPGTADRYSLQDAFPLWSVQLQELQE